MSSEQQEIQQQQEPIQQQEQVNEQASSKEQPNQQQAPVNLKYDIELEKDTSDKGNLKKVVIRTVGKENSFNLFNTKKGRDLVFTYIQEALKGKSEDKQIQLSACSSAIYILLHAITELQHEKKIKVLSTENLTNSDNQQVLATIVVL